VRMRRARFSSSGVIRLLRASARLAGRRWALCGAGATKVGAVK
jgi:hypothetical protein